MPDEPKIKLWDLLQHVLKEADRYGSDRLIEASEYSCSAEGKTAWCKLMVEELNDKVREKIARMQQVVLVVLGLKLSVTVYSRCETFKFKESQSHEIQRSR